MQKLLEIRHWLKPLKFEKAVTSACFPVGENNNMETGVCQSLGK